MLMEMWQECNKVRLIPNIEDIRSFIVEELKKFDNEHTRLFEIELACSSGASLHSKFDMFDEALKKTSTEKMHRLYLQWLNAFVKFKIRALLHDLCDNGWMKEKDWLNLEKEIETIKEEFGVEFIKKCLERRPQSAVIWNVYLENCLDEGIISPDEFRETCNRALDKVDPNDSFPIWQRAIEYSIVHDPSETEKIFRESLINTNSSVRSRIKILFLEYLDELFKQSKITDDKMREKVMELVNNKPNSPEFYCAVHLKELNRPQPDYKFAGFVIKSAVNEEGCASVEALILYAKWALRYEPTKFHVVHQMGLKLFEGALLDEFMIRWTRLLQNTAKDVREVCASVFLQLF
uniref:Suf domain-containing protein n=1 Tax=Angiostrongylus cantonensis TaxID=6313 RepID=A0A0K0DLA7_ANGCA